MRVLHVSESTVGGIGVFIAALARHQLAAEHQVGVAVPAAGAIPRELAAAGARVFAWDVVAQPGPAVPGELRRLAGIVRAFDPELVHLHSSKAGLVGRLLVRGRRATILQPHSWSFYARTGAIQRATLAWERFAVRWLDVVLCVSEDERRLGRAKGVRAEMAVLPNGVDLERFAPPAAGARADARRRLGLGDEPLVVCVGRLHRQKNQAALLDAWPTVLEEVPDARLVLLGDGPDRAALAARAGARVQVAGSTSDVQTWLTAASVIAQPSRWEGMSLSLLEAMACARSVVVTDVPGMAEVVADGVGAVVAPGDRIALARALADRLRDPARADAEGAAGRAAVEAQHDQRVQHAGIDALYERVLRARRSSTVS